MKFGWFKNSKILKESFGYIGMIYMQKFLLELLNANINLLHIYIILTCSHPRNISSHLHKLKDAADDDDTSKNKILFIIK